MSQGFHFLFALKKKLGLRLNGGKVRIAAKDASAKGKASSTLRHRKDPVVLASDVHGEGLGYTRLWSEVLKLDRVLPTRVH